MNKREVPEFIRALHFELKKRYKDCTVRLLNGNLGGITGTILGNILERDGHMYRVGCRISYKHDATKYYTEAILYPDSKLGRDSTIECGSKKFDINEPGSIDELLVELDSIVVKMKDLAQQKHNPN